MAEWHDFFIAQVGALAALCGLLFVSLSINIQSILKYPWLPPRAAQSLVVLVAALILASLVLAPSQDQAWLKIASLVVAVGAWLIVCALTYSSARAAPPNAQPRRASHVLGPQLATLPAIVGTGIALAGGEGYAWIAGGVLFSLMWGVLNAWVLLVEILR